MNPEIVVIKQSESDNMYTTNYVTEVFETSNDLNLIRTVVEKAEERIYISWASVDSIDKANEKIPIADIIKNQETLLKRGGPIMVSHSSMQVGKTLAFKVMQHPETKTLGVLHLNKIYSDNVKDDEVWANIKSGKYKGSSVGGYTTDSEIGTDDNKLYKTLIGFKQFETSIVEKPCNPFALNESFSTVAKSANTKETKKVGIADIHSDKWKRCFDGLTADGKSDESAAAICTASLGEESFKSDELKKMVKEKIQETKKENVLEVLLSKLSSGEELSESEQNALNAAMEAAQNVLGQEEESAPAPEEEKQEESSEEAPEQEEGMSDLEKTVMQLKERLDMVEDQISGNASTKSEDEPEEEETEKSEPSKEESAKSTKKSDEVAELKKELAEIKKSLKQTEKSGQVKEVIKSERPAQAVKKGLTALDVALGKAKYNPKTGTIEEK